MYGKSMALDLWDRYRLSVPVDLRRLTAELGLEVEMFPFGGRIKEVIIGRTSRGTTGTSALMVPLVRGTRHWTPYDARRDALLPAVLAVGRAC